MRYVRFATHFKEIPETPGEVSDLRKEFPWWRGDALCFPNSPTYQPRSILDTVPSGPTLCAFHIE